MKTKKEKKGKEWIADYVAERDKAAEVQRDQDDAVVEDYSEEAAGVDEQPKYISVEEIPSLLDLSDELLRCQNKLLFLNDCFIMRNVNIEYSLPSQSMEGLTLIIKDIEEKMKDIAEKMVQTKE